MLVDGSYPLNRCSLDWPHAVPGTSARRASAVVSCRVSKTVAATAFGVTRTPLSGLGPQNREAVLARQVAMYLSHVCFGVAMTDIAKVFRRDRTTVTHACHTVEDRRDDHLFDGMLDRMEAAALALRSAHIAWQDR